VSAVGKSEMTYLAPYCCVQRPIGTWSARAAVPPATRRCALGDCDQRPDENRPSLEILGIDADVIVVTRDKVPYAKPDPDFFMAAARRLGVSIEAAVVVGDSVCGICWRPVAPKPWVLDYCREATARTNWNAPAPTGSTSTLLI